MEACVLGGDDARVEVCRLLKAGGATLMTSKNTLDDGVRLFSCDTTNTRYRRYAALDKSQRPDIMRSRCAALVSLKTDPPHAGLQLRHRLHLCSRSA